MQISLTNRDVRLTFLYVSQFEMGDMQILLKGILMEVRALITHIISTSVRVCLWQYLMV